MALEVPLASILGPDGADSAPLVVEPARVTCSARPSPGLLLHDGTPGMPIWTEDHAKAIMTGISVVFMEHGWRIWQARQARESRRIDVAVGPTGIPPPRHHHPRHHHSTAHPCTRLTRCTGAPARWTGQHPISPC